MAGGCERAWTSLDVEDEPRVVWCRPPDDDRVVLLLGAFDPPTRAHLSLAQGVARLVGVPGGFCLTKVLLDRPEESLLTPDGRLRLLDEVAGANGLALAISNRGTYLEVARVLASARTKASFVIGSDKLSQLADPSFYEDGERGVEATFSEVNFIVVPRSGFPVEREDVSVISPDDVFATREEMEISSTEVRRRLRTGLDIAMLVPPEVAVGLGGYTQRK